jgi:glycosyltransferase involved in cell wall biosynthesis
MTTRTDLRPTLSIVMPVYNEIATLRTAVERLLKTSLPVSWELVMVDDGSMDGSIGSVVDLVDGSVVRAIRLPANRGKGAALRIGFEAASGEFATVLDADLEYDPADFGALVEPLIAGEATVTYGTRSFGAHTAFSFWFVLGNKALGWWASFLYNTWLSDVETCFKMAPADTWRDLDIRSPGFGIEAEVTGKLLRRGHRIYEVPIRYKARTREEGKKLEWRDGAEALWILLRVRVTGS